MTNADKIRAMSDEELAEYFADMASEDIYDDPGIWLVWLKKKRMRNKHETPYRKKGLPAYNVNVGW